MTDTERKLQLTRFIRQENAANRMKLKNREDILYGNKKTFRDQEEMPLYYDGHLGEEEYYINRPQDAPHSTFGFRLVLAVLLFAAVVYMDKNQTALFGQPACEVIARQVGAETDEKLIDFMKNISYSFGR